MLENQRNSRDFRRVHKNPSKKKVCITDQYEHEIVHVLRVPLTRVTAREFWVRHPNGTWQFFLIRHDAIIEIRADGTWTPEERFHSHFGTCRGGGLS